MKIFALCNKMVIANSVEHQAGASAAQGELLGQLVQYVQAYCQEYVERHTSPNGVVITADGTHQDVRFDESYAGNNVLFETDGNHLAALTASLYAAWHKTMLQTAAYDMYGLITMQCLTASTNVTVGVGSVLIRWHDEPVSRCDGIDVRSNTPFTNVLQICTMGILHSIEQSLYRMASDVDADNESCRFMSINVCYMMPEELTNRDAVPLAFSIRYSRLIDPAQHTEQIVKLVNTFIVQLCHTIAGITTDHNKYCKNANCSIAAQAHAVQKLHDEQNEQKDDSAEDEPAPRADDADGDDEPAPHADADANADSEDEPAPCADDADGDDEPAPHVDDDADADADSEDEPASHADDADANADSDDEPAPHADDDADSEDEPAQRADDGEPALGYDRLDDYLRNLIALNVPIASAVLMDGVLVVKKIDLSED